MLVWLQIQGSRVRSRSGPILSWTLIMKWFLRSFSSLPLIHSRRVVVSYKQKYVHELLVNRLFKPAQEKVWLGELTVPQWPKLLTWDVKQQNKQTKNLYPYFFPSFLLMGTWKPGAEFWEKSIWTIKNGKIWCSLKELDPHFKFKKLAV